MLVSAAKLVYANATHLCQAFQRWQMLKKFVAFSGTTLLRDDLTGLTEVLSEKTQLLFFSLCYYKTSEAASHPGNFGSDKQTSIEDCLAVPKIKHLV